MKNKVFIGALLASFAAFVLYLNNIQRNQSAKLEITQAQTKKNTNKEKEPSFNLKVPTNSGDIQVSKASNSDLAKNIKATMGNSEDYQVKVTNLADNKKSAYLYASEKRYEASDTLKAFLLVAYYQAISSGKIQPNGIVTVKQDQLASGEQLFKANVNYSLSYVTQVLLSQNNTTSANILLDKLGKNQINQLLEQLGFKNTSIEHKFGVSHVGYTSAEDLDNLLTKLYQGKIISNYSNRVLSLLTTMKTRSSLVSKITGANIIQIGDSHNAAAIITSAGHSYTLAISANKNEKFAELGANVNNWQINH